MTHATMAPMAKKNKVSKKHRFKYAAPAGSAASPAPIAVASVQASSAAEAVALGRDFSYVAHDIRRILVFAVGLVALEAALSYLLGHTSVGPSVYNFFNV